jgi:hypothetical protein
MSSKFGSGGRPPQAPPIDPSVILKNSTDVRCEKCGNATFAQVFLIKHISSVASPNGEEGIIPIPTYACNVCNNVNPEFIPSVLRKAADERETTSNKITLVKE